MSVKLTMAAAPRSVPTALAPLHATVTLDIAWLVMDMHAMVRFSSLVFKSLN